MAERILYTELTSWIERGTGTIREGTSQRVTYVKKVSVLKYLFGKADVSEALLDGVKLLRVEFAGDDVLHHSARLTINIPAGRSTWSSFP